MSWRPALRIARRDAVRAKGRSALVVAMVALPVLGLGGLDVLLRSAQLDPGERIARDLGRTQAQLTPIADATELFQAPDPDDGITITESGPIAGKRNVVPSGYRLLTSRDASLPFRTEGGEASLLTREVDVADPAFAGRFVLREGRAARSAGEVAVTRRALERLDAEVGGTATLIAPRRELDVVGVVDAVAERGLEAVWAQPGTLISGVRAELAAPPEIFLVGDRPIGWPEVRRLNSEGVIVLSRSVLLDPPPRSEVPYYTQGHAVGESQEVLTVALAVAVAVTLAALEVILLAGAAFAVGARRQARSLGLLAAAGGEARDVRRVVLAGGVVLGSVGAVLGLVLGIALAAAVMPLLERHADANFGHFDLRPLELAAAAATGLVVAVLAAVLPARSASRQDPVAALSGRRGQVRTPRRVPAFGLLLVGLGVATASVGSVFAVSRAVVVNPTAGGTATVAAALIAGGAALAQLGLIVCSPALVGLAGRWSRRLPLPLRLALTDASRHRGRSAPAVSAVLTAVTGATALALVVAAFDRRDRESYQPIWPPGTAGVALEEHGSIVAGEQQVTLVPPQRVLAAVGPQLPTFEPVVLRAAPSCSGPAEDCVFTQPIIPTRNECPAWRNSGPASAADAATDWRCDPRRIYAGGGLAPTPTGDADVLRALAGKAPASAVRTLDEGGVVLLDRRYLDRDHVTVERSTLSSTRPPERVRLPATALDVPRPPVIAIYSEGATRRLRIDTKPLNLLLRFTEPPTTEQEDAARSALRRAGIDAAFGVERGYRSDYGLGLLALVLGAAVITLGAAGIATGLAQADARADHATLAAVGATPGLRRVLAAAQAFSVAGLGALLGVLAGLVPGIAFVGALDSLHLVVPWGTLAQVVVGIPLLAAAAAWLFTRSRLPLERRVAA
jgi:putative ABC transport system permease protein